MPEATSSRPRPWLWRDNDCSHRTAHRLPSPDRRDLHLFAGKPANQEGRDLRRIGEWLVIDLRKLRDDIASFMRRLRYARDAQCRDEPATSRAKLASLNALLVEADGESPDLLRRIFLVERDDGRGIETTRQEGSYRDIGQRLARYRAGESSLKLRDCVGLIADRVTQPCPNHVFVGPVARDGHAIGAVAYSRRLVTRLGVSPLS